MEQVVPGSIVYSDLKPEAIINDVRLIKYYPTSNVNGQLPQDLIRFDLRGNGYFDPYSAYVFFEIIVDPVTAPSASTYSSAQLLDDSAHSMIQRLVIRSEGTELERLENYDVLAKILNDVTYSQEMRTSHHVEGFGQHSVFLNATKTGATILGSGSNASSVAHLQTDQGVFHIRDYTADQSTTEYPDTVAGGLLVQNTIGGKTSSQSGTDGGGIHNYLPAYGQTTLRFAVPLYSGILGLLMPEKKMIPLSYMPLEVEFTLNPYAFYAVGGHNSRSYTISKMEIHSHIVTFEHEVALQMDSVVARQGLYIPYESFFQAATTVSSEVGNDATITIPVNAHFKSITSLHMVMIPSGFETNNKQKKLQFVSGNLKSLQVRNGINYLPSLPITGSAGDLYSNNHTLFYQEMLKSWNRLHDNAAPININPMQYCSNTYYSLATAENIVQADFTRLFYTYPKCQYGISFQGEELGKDSGTITGKRGLTPFNIECQFTAPIKLTTQANLQNPVGVETKSTSLYFIPFVRADFLVYVRPDLVVQVLGK